MYLSCLKKISAGEKKGGIYGAGPMVSNKLLQMGSLVGLFPFQFLMQADIAESTCTFRFLKTVFKMERDTDFSLLLDGIASVTRTNPRIAEAACCKASQEWSFETKGKKITAVDTIYKGMSILTSRVENSSRIPNIRIVEITIVGERILDRSELS